MKFYVLGKNKDNVNIVKKLLKKYNLKYSKNPDIVVSLGGDGTYLLCERIFPEIPKLLIRDKSICIRCDRHSLSSINNILNKITKNKYKIKENIKLEAIYKNKKLTAVNEISIRNKFPTEAIRFSLKTNKKSYNNLIGDGLVISTPFGSTAYFHSITRKSFNKGIGIAFNNPLKKINPINLKDTSKIKVKINRGKALLSADNNPKIIKLKQNKEILIKKSKQKAKIVVI